MNFDGTDERPFPYQVSSDKPDKFIEMGFEPHDDKFVSMGFEPHQDQNPALFDTSIREWQNTPSRSPIAQGAKLLSKALPEDLQKMRINPGIRGTVSTLMPVGSQMAGAYGGGLLGEAIGPEVGAGLGFLAAGPPGAFVGAMAGETAGPAVGAFLGGMSGWTGGKTAARVLNHAVLGDDVANAYKEIPSDALEGLAYETGGKAIQAIPGVVKSWGQGIASELRSSFGDSLLYKLKENATQIKDAMKALGISNPPKAFFTPNQGYQKLEQSVGQSGSAVATPYRNQYDQFAQEWKSARDVVSSIGSPDTADSLGSDIKDKLKSIIGGNKQYASDLYKPFEGELEKIQVDPKAVEYQIAALRRNKYFRSAQGQAFLDNAKEEILQNGDLNSLKEHRSLLHADLEKGASDLDALRRDELYDAVTEIRNKSIEAHKASLPEYMHPEVDNLLSQIKAADAAHAGNVDQLNQLSDLIGGRKVKSAGEFLRALERTDSSDLYKRASNLKTNTLQFLKDNFSETSDNLFDHVTTAKVNELIKSASTKDGLSVPTFMKRYSAMSQAQKDMLFPQPIQKHIENLGLISEEMPTKLGPSGTPEGQKRGKLFTPAQNVEDLGNRLLLNSLQKEGEGRLSKRPILDAWKKKTYLTPMIQGATGLERWATDGYNNLVNHVNQKGEKDESK